jgi:tetratricopeptide (TPR) repeat protein
MRCLAKDADARPQQASDIVRVLDTVTSGGGHTAMPPILLGGRFAMWRALAIYAVAFVVVALVAKASIIAIGLPDWVYPGALIVMALGLPVIVFTGYVQHAARRAITMTPTYTPGGTQAPQGTMATIAMKASPHMSWRRTAMGGAYSLGAFVLLVGAFMLLRALGIGPAGSLLAAGKFDAKQPLLVAEFAAKGGADSSLGGVVAEAVRADLGQSNIVNIMPVSMIHDALQRMQKSPDTRVDANVARQIAQRNGLKAVVTGDVTPLGGGFIVTARIVAAETGNELASFQETANGPADLIGTVGKLSKDLRGKIGESLKSVQASPPLEAVTTSSLDALRKYAEGETALNGADYPRAADALKQAVAIDSTFAMAWRKLAIVYADAGMSPALIDSAITRAYRNRDHLTDRERYATIGTYFDVGPGRDRAKAAQAYQQAIAAGEYSASAHNLGNALVSLRQYTRADSAYRLRIVHDPGVSAITFQQLGLALLDAGKDREADSVARDGLRRFGPDYRMDGVRAAVFYNAGKMDSVSALIDRWRNSPVAPARSAVRYAASSMAERNGQLHLAEREFADARAIDRARGADFPLVADSAIAAFFDAWFRGQGARAVRTMDAALAATPLSSLPLKARPYANVVTVYALAGRPDRARAIVAQMEAAARDTNERVAMSADRHLALGWVALAENKPLDAVREFRASDSLPDGPANDCSACVAIPLGLAFDRANMPDSAIAEFERYLGMHYSDRYTIDGDMLAFTYKSLGELYEAKGNPGEAANYYAKFVDLWKNADPDLQPQVANVRQRLAHLKDTEKRP